LPRADISAARVASRASASRSTAVEASSAFHQAAHRQRQVRAGVAVGTG
jgi:hypothetical protein